MGRAFADVLMDIAHRRVDHPFTYEIPAEMQPVITVGTRVVVPFGSRKAYGYVLKLRSETPVEKTKLILDYLDQYPVFGQEHLKLAKWIASYYLCPLIVALKGILPAAYRGASREKAKTLQYVQLVDEALAVNYLESKGLKAPKQAEVLKVLLERKSLALKEIVKLVGASYNTVKALAEKHLVYIDSKEIDRSWIIEGKAAKPVLNDAQIKALLRINDAIDNNRQMTFLLQGVTASGKTEVYLQALERVVSLGRQGIVLVPEISLTPQTVRRFTARFDRVAVLHSGLTSGERFDAWRKIRQGEIDVVIGARSAIFAPLPEIGLIVIDEEHETSYLQESNPKYHAREVALKRAEYHQAVCILGTATPSLETAYLAGKGQYQLLKLPDRVGKLAMPKVTVVDMRQEIKNGNRKIFSSDLLGKMEYYLDQGRQVILFLNRRGYYGFLLCRDCGCVITCPHCDVSLTFHLAENELRCHYCGYRQEIPAFCPECGGKRLKNFGVGTQRIEKEALNFFPGYNIIRVDRDTVKGKEGHLKLLDAFAEGRAQIMIGTQMIAKGLDFTNVSLVGVITVDNILNLPDFRSRERTFQLITQVAGRAGRGEHSGEVIVQTYHPEDPAIKYAKRQDYDSFYRYEIEERRKQKYPPFCQILRFAVGSLNEKIAQEAAEQLLQAWQRLKVQGDFTILGPAPAAVAKVKDLHYRQLIIKGNNLDELRKNAEKLLNDFQLTARDLVVSVDVNPLGF